MHYSLGRKNLTKPHPSLPSGRVTPASEYAQLGWICHRLPALLSAAAAHRKAPPDMRRPPPGLASQCEGLTTEEDKALPDGYEKP
ncbi:hypothetical protein GCM10010220_03240 [Streptomyces parvulus]|nr:hypothetical protein GCM10010220_03240 [Streptomyces parvulus]